jgi:putative transposase
MEAWVEAVLQGTRQTRKALVSRDGPCLPKSFSTKILKNNFLDYFLFSPNQLQPRSIQMKFYQGKIYHVYNRGNNRQKIFFNRENYLFFLNKVRTHLTDHCDLLAWCLMPNHFHWMIRVHDNYEQNPDNSKQEKGTTSNVQPLNRSISVLLSSYTKAMNRMYDRTGSLFQKRTKAKELDLNEGSDDQYPLICFLYIHQNPMKAKLADRLDEWEFSSFQDYSGLRKGSLCNKKLTAELLELPLDHKKFIALSYKTLPDDLINGLF